MVPLENSVSSTRPLLANFDATAKQTVGTNLGNQTKEALSASKRQNIQHRVSMTTVSKVFE